MKRSVFSATISTLVYACVLATIGCQPAAPDTNRDAARTANANAAKPAAIDTAAIEAELLKLEREWAAASQSHNSEPVKRIVADDVNMVYPDGTTGTKADEISSIESGTITVESWDLVDPKVTILNENAAYITGRGVIKNGKVRDPQTKRTRDISGEYRFTDIYLRRNGQWQAVASQTTRIENPTPVAEAPKPPAKAETSPAVKPSPAK
jgi:Domain of unknown function (DUF4440)